VTESEAALGRRCLAEFIGTAALLMAIVGSGIAVQPSGSGPVQLAINAGITGLALIAIIASMGSVSGAHLNPVVSIADRIFGGLSTKGMGAYIGSQIAGAAVGTIAANLMFDLGPAAIATASRSGPELLFSEVLVTLGLLLVIFGLARSGRSDLAAIAIGAYVAAAIVWSSSTAFANPAVTIGRMLTNTFTGIAPASVPPFIAAQLVGMGLAVGLVRMLFPTFGPKQAKRLVVARKEG
jgi:arsenate reductase